MKNQFMNPENVKNINKVGKYNKIEGKITRKTLNVVLMLVMRFLTNLCV